MSLKDWSVDCHLLKSLVEITLHDIIEVFDLYYISDYVLSNWQEQYFKAEI